ncbi:uncharacterized protein DSM5745_07953 [Aspergillus mulundensis]|uniref:Uncharacterized protein n=1 Tax=Aspergillus mulundensis TaxID=1810919 RepID=A0A3D8RFZ0_9EURO|nr:hypothetical protein DSM5745_07953 [Aspergillus mulundensis]RDW72781.1 hypothetical protein DSM5745_07953 [Aspergillus mulundensis]
MHVRPETSGRRPPGSRRRSRGELALGLLQVAKLLDGGHGDPFLLNPPIGISIVPSIVKKKYCEPNFNALGFPRGSAVRHPLTILEEVKVLDQEPLRYT